MLTASAVNYLIKILPKGTAYCIGIVLVVMMTGPGRPKKHGDILHPGWDSPEIAPDEEIVAMHLKGELRLRRWKHLHFEDAS